jgi:thiamine pyrophosphate-dependent acetolactate synthase large subunit-like protein
LLGPNVFVRTTGTPHPWVSVAAFAHLTNIGVVVAPGGKGAIDPNSPLYLYALNFTPYDWSNYALLWADVVIAIGYDQAEIPAGAWNYRPVPVIHINDIPAEVGLAYKPAVCIW